MQQILEDWEESCRQDLRIPIDKLPWIIFYDRSFAWHVSPDRRLLPAQQRPTKHVLRFAGRSYRIHEVAHTGRMWVPGRDPIDLPRNAYTMPYANSAKAFLVIGTPEFLAGEYGDEARSKQFRDLWRGFAMHELTHTRQFPQLIPILERLQKQYRLPESIDDDLIETTFSRNSEFKRLYDEALGHLMAATLAPDNGTARERTRAALQVIRSWQQRFFAGEYEGWGEVEEAFLCMEGAGQWAHYRHALRMAPPGQPWRQTVFALAVATDSWSQNLGIGLFLLIDRFVPSWRERYFSKSSPPPSPLSVLEAAILEPPRTER